MILYQLKCSTEHQFEAWFRDSATYDQQCASGDIDCPFCGDNGISKVPMAPNLGKRSAQREVGEGRAREVAEQILQAVNKLREHVEENCEDVGDRFAEEARRMHVGETEDRGIYGEATSEEAMEMDEEGIEYFRLPSTNRRND